MNKQRRKAIGDIYDKLIGIQYDLEYIRDEEQEAFDNLPESIQYSERGERMEEYISSLEEALDNVGYAVESLDEENYV